MESYLASIDGRGFLTQVYEYENSNCSSYQDLAKKNYERHPEFDKAIATGRFLIDQYSSYFDYEHMVLGGKMSFLGN